MTTNAARQPRGAGRRRALVKVGDIVTDKRGKKARVDFILGDPGKPGAFVFLDYWYAYVEDGGA